MAEHHRKQKAQLTVRVPDDVWNRLKSLAEKNDRNVTQEVRRAVRLYLENNNA